MQPFKLAVWTLSKSKSDAGPPSESAFKAEGALAGRPYRVKEGGIVEAMMQGGLVRFENMDQFRAASEGRDG